MDFTPTPYRNTRAVFDSPEVALVEPPASVCRITKEIARGTLAKTENTRLVEGIGWQLKPYQAAAGDSAERQAAQAGIMRPIADGGTLTASAMFAKFAAWRQSDDTGVTYGAGSATSGDDHYEVQVPAGGSLSDANQTADQTAFPGIPTDSVDPNLVRLAVDTVPDKPNQPIYLKLTVADAIVGSGKSLGVLYFTGPASQSTDSAGLVQGLGQYAFEVLGDGTANIWERQKLVDFENPQWIKVAKNLRWCPPALVAGVAHFIEIISREFSAPRNNRTGFIQIHVADSSTAAGESAASPLAMFATTNPTGVLRYNASCEDPTKWVKAVEAPVRKDVRADLAPALQLSRAVYPATGYVVDDPAEFFVIPSYITGSNVTLAWLGEVPSGTTLTVDLFPYSLKPADDPITGTAFSAVSTFGGSYNGFKKYEVPFLLDLNGDAISAYVAKVSFTSDGQSTPTLRELRVYKDGHGETSGIDETAIDHPIMSFSMSGQDSTTGRESCSMTFTDLFGDATMPALRALMPTKIDTQYSETDEEIDEDSPRSILFRGYLASSPSEKLYRDPIQGIDVEARKYEAELVGMHQRLDEAIAPFIWSFAEDPDSGTTIEGGLPYLASDAIFYCLLWAGFLPDEIGWDIGDPRYPTRMYGDLPGGSAPSLQVNTGDPLGEKAMGFARDFLGRYLVYCPNSSRTAPADGEAPTGMWEIVEPPFVPYRPLARFEVAPVATGGDAALYLAHSPWPDWTYRERAVPVRAFFKGEKKRIEPPEFNVLTVTSVGDTKAVYSPEHTGVTVWNPKSFNYISGAETADPTSPDYLGRARRAIDHNSAYGNQGGVIFAARRLFDYAMKGRIVRSITAPLVLVQDQDSSNLRRRRPLRPNDCIVIRGKFCAVRSAAIFASKDGFKMQRIEAQQLPDDEDNPIE